MTILCMLRYWQVNTFIFLELITTILYTNNITVIICFPVLSSVSNQDPVKVENIKNVADIICGLGVKKICVNEICITQHFYNVQRSMQLAYSFYDSCYSYIVSFQTNHSVHAADTSRCCSGKC